MLTHSGIKAWQLRWLALAFASVPAVNALADLTTNLPDLPVPTGALRVFLYTGLLLITGKFLFGRHVLVSKLVLTWIVWMSVICLTQSFFHTSMEEAGWAILYKEALAMLAFFVGYKILSSVDSYTTILRGITVGALAINLGLLYTNFAKVGAQYYGLETYLGGALVQITYGLAVYLAVYAFYRRRLKSWLLPLWLLDGLAVGSLILCLLVGRRISIVAAALCILVLVLRSGGALRKAGIFLLCLSGLLSLNETRAVTSLQRFESIEATREEGRIQELVILQRDLANASLPGLVFGATPFKSELHFFTNRRVRSIWLNDRPLHVDFAVILHGFGLFGFALHYLVLFALGWFLLKNKSGPNVSRDAQFGLFILGLGLVIGLSGSIGYFSFRFLYFILLGAVVGQIERQGTRTLMGVRQGRVLVHSA